MPAHLEALRAAAGDAAKTLLRCHAVLAATGASLLVAGCLQTPLPPSAAKDPADPAARTARVGYQPVLGSYTSRRPVEPVPWREQNERVAPDKR